MSTAEAPRYSPRWLALRESADAAARAPGLLEPLRGYLGDPARRASGLLIRDLGCGTGSMGRWLAPQLDGSQHWILHDRDPDLLTLAVTRAPRTAADGSRVTAAAECGDIVRLTAGHLAGTSLVTGSALLDLLTREEVDGLAAACAGAGCAALLALSVAGRVELTPADPLDAEIAGAFNAHQRRSDHGRRLLGPDAARAAREAFTRLGATVMVRSSPWRLGAGGTPPADAGDTPTQGEASGGESALTAEWLRGWVGAACEQRPDLASSGGGYLRRRLEAATAGRLRVVVHHSDLLALPRPKDGTS